MKYSIPRWAKWFFPEDVKDAFEHVIVAEADRHMMTMVPPIRIAFIDFTAEELESWGYSRDEITDMGRAGELMMQWQHAPQGLAPIAPFWNVYMAHGLNCLFGEEWHRWIALFVDDVLGYGMTKEQAVWRQRIVNSAFRALNKRLSNKLDRTVTQEGQIAGMKFTAEGVQITDEAVDSLVVAMTEALEAKKMTEKQARRLVGIIIYAQSSFK
jgi:hypothetical protein